MAMNLITANEAGEQLGVSRPRVLALIRAGRLPAQKIGVQYLIRPADLEKVRVRKPGRPVGSKGAKPGPKPKAKR